MALNDCGASDARSLTPRTGLSQTDESVPKAKRTKIIKKISTSRPRRSKISHECEVFKVGGGPKYQALGVFSYPEDGN